MTAGSRDSVLGTAQVALQYPTPDGAGTATTFWDTANVYGGGTSEEIVGRAIKQLTAREEIVLATKIFMPMHQGPGGGGLSRKAILEQVDASLRRLGTDYVDLLQIHRFDPDVPVEETMEALHDVVKAGKARYLGASSMWGWRFSKLQHAAETHGWTRFISMQDQYSLLAREEEREMVGCSPTRASAPCPGARSRPARSPDRGARPDQRARRPTRTSTCSATRCGWRATRRPSTPSSGSPPIATSRWPQSR